MNKSAPRPPPPPPPSTDASGLAPMVSRRSLISGQIRCPKEYETPEEECSQVCRRLFDNEKFHEEHCYLVSLNCKALPILQEGPSCGLAALCMAAQILGTCTRPVPLLSEVLEVARCQGFTRKGEMFSAVSMCSLAQEVFSIDVHLLTDGLDQRTKVVLHLAAGQPILVPYDADMNHEPTCRQGHKAHWAVLTGVLVAVPAHSRALPTSLRQDTAFPVLYHGEIHSRSDHCVDQLATAGGAKVYVYARQGKSRHLSAWSYDTLARSNANLTELSPLRRRSVDGYILPVDGVEGGLCRKALLLSRKETPQE